MGNHWLKMYKIAQEYYEKFGNLCIKQDYVTDDGIKLGIWINTQRFAYKNRYLSADERIAKYVPLTDEQVELLESIGMIWSLREYNFVNKPMNDYKLITLKRRFLDFLDKYEKNYKFNNSDDVKNIENDFVKTLGSHENHYKSGW